MDNIGDWLYIVFLVIAAISGLFSSGKKKKSQPDILGQPDKEIATSDELPQEKGFWELLQEMQKSEPRPQVKPKQKPMEKRKVAMASSPKPFLSSESSIHDAIAKQKNPSILHIEEEIGIMPEETFQNMEELKKAFICAEILNRKY